MGMCVLDCKLNPAILLHTCVDMNLLSTGSQLDWPLVRSMSDVLSQDARRFGVQKKKALKCFCASNPNLGTTWQTQCRVAGREAQG